MVIIDIENDREHKTCEGVLLKDIPDSNLLQLIGAAISLNNRKLTDDAQILLIEAEYRYDNGIFVSEFAETEKRVAFLQSELDSKQREIESLKRELFDLRQQNESAQSPTPKCQNPFNVGMKVTGFNVY